MKRGCSNNFGVATAKNPTKRIDYLQKNTEQINKVTFTWQMMETLPAYSDQLRACYINNED